MSVAHGKGSSRNLVVSINNINYSNKSPGFRSNASPTQKGSLKKLERSPTIKTKTVKQPLIKLINSRCFDFEDKIKGSLLTE